MIVVNSAKFSKIDHKEMISLFILTFLVYNGNLKYVEMDMKTMVHLLKISLKNETIPLIFFSFSESIH